MVYTDRPSSGNIATRIYNDSIDPEGNPADAYGYWVAVFGIIIAIVGVGIFLWGTTFTPGGDPYWAFRRAGIVLVATGVPLAMFGISLRLHLHPAAAALGAIGLLVSVAAIIWFMFLYPENWTFSGNVDVYIAQRQVILTYMTGIVLLAGAYTVVPVVADRITAEADSAPQSYYELFEERDRYGWRLYEDEDIIASSTRTFPSRSDARTAIDELSMTAPVAGIEIVHPEAANDQ